MDLRDVVADRTSYPRSRAGRLPVATTMDRGGPSAGPSPIDGDTKPCPKCRETMIFRSRYPQLTSRRSPSRTGSEVGERIEYERAWVCRNSGCDHREIVGG